MQFIYRLEDRILGPVVRLLDGAVITTLIRFAFLAVLAGWFWKSAWGKIGEGLFGFLKLDAGAYVTVLPKQMEAVGYDPSQLGFISHAIVYLGTWGEFVIPALVIVGLFTRGASVAMIVFILVLSIVDITGHNADPVTIGAWFDGIPDAKIIDQRFLWILLLLVLVIRGGGPLSLDALLKKTV